MGKYENLIKEDVSCQNIPLAKRIKDIEKLEKDKFQNNIEILSEFPREVNYNNSEKSINEKNVLRKVISLTNATYFYFI